LSGGEPTLHQQLPEIVHMVRHEFGLSPVLVTNGLKLAEDPQYAQVLKDQGLHEVHLQFDTLDPDTYYKIRRRRDFSEKFRAIDNIRAAGMKLGLVVTVCQYNLAELGRLVDYACGLVPTLKILVFQPAVPLGRFPADICSVTREDVIRELIESGSTYRLRASDFFPFPPATSGQSLPHADCSAHVILCVERDHAYPLAVAPRPSAVLASPSHHAPPRGGLLSAKLIPRKTLDDMRSALRRGQRHCLLVSVIAFMHPRTRDEQRMARCIVGMVSEDGIVGLCERGCSGLGKIA
jgi:hypothetical protein